ncbi:methyltransferase domain-containing protein [candidate division KSB1 bacterium]|nr:methyltransferase domain-containing protein [candidate division KSB1 bacterium]
MPNHHPITNELSNKDLFTFVTFYLSQRYNGLISDKISSFSSTEEFVEKMLRHLIENGLDSTRQKFFNDHMMPHFHRIYGKVKPRNFAYDGKVFLPFIQNLPPNSFVLDFGAGNNNFLPAIANRSGREDIEYYATDYFVDERKSLDRGRVKFIHQPRPYELPKDRYFDFIFLRRTAHHIPDFEVIIEEIKIHLKHKTFSGWEDELRNSGMGICLKFNMGFPKSFYNLHQPATGILCCKVKA